MCVGSVCVLSVCEQEEVAAFFWYGPANEASVVDEKGVRRTTLWRLMRQWWDCNCQSVDWLQGPRTGGPPTRGWKALDLIDRGFKRLGVVPRTTPQRCTYSGLSGLLSGGQSRTGIRHLGSPNPISLNPSKL